MVCGTYSVDQAIALKHEKQKWFVARLREQTLKFGSIWFAACTAWTKPSPSNMKPHKWLVHLRKQSVLNLTACVSRLHKHEERKSKILQYIHINPYIQAQVERLRVEPKAQMLNRARSGNSVLR